MLKCGDKVLNFDIVAAVVRFHAVTGDLVPEDFAGDQWIVDVMKCLLLTDECNIGNITGGRSIKCRKRKSL